MFVRRVRTTSGATAVQVMEYARGRQRVLKHVGSAHGEAELRVLEARAAAWMEEVQPGLDLEGVDPVVSHGRLAREEAEQGVLLAAPSGWSGRRGGGPEVVSTTCGVLRDVVVGAFERVGLGVVGDEVFKALVVARVVEATSKLDAGRVIKELGMTVPSYSTIRRGIKRISQMGYRDQVAQACFDHASGSSGLSLLLYDVSTLYFEVDREDSFRKVGFSKERRVDPQIIIGILVDRGGFPLELHSYEGNKAETQTMVPVIRAFQERHHVEDMVVVADAGMLSASNLQALEEAGLRFVVGSRQVKAPQDLASHFHFNGSAATEGQVVEVMTPKGRKKLEESLTSLRITPRWDPALHPGAWRAVWQYRHKRAVRDTQTLALQKARAQDILEGRRTQKNARFLQVVGGEKALDEKAYQRAVDLAGWKGYVTNIPACVMDASEVISSYHELWHVEQSFRMSKHDLQARPIHHHQREAIDAHLTIVFAALAVSRELQNTTGVAIANIVKQLRPLRSATITAAGTTHEFAPHIPPKQQDLIDRATTAKPTH